MAAPAIIFELVDRFRRNRQAYDSPAYNEAQVRSEFIDPVFQALGWDMHNAAGHAEPYKDVVVESRLKVKGGSKAPDYSFRVGGLRKFFVEAKKPSVKIKTDPEPAFQLRRYAWSAKLPLSVLTNFGELAVYDCRQEPKATDKPSAARVLYVTYEDYLPHWDQLSEIFAKEAVLKGLFDGYADSTRAKRGTAEVDDAFLAEMRIWREALARNIALRNKALTESELNYSVQQTIDRIVFLRICEDRGIEPYGQLQGLLARDGVYARLLALFKRADDRYNSGLFHFRAEAGRREIPDTLTTSIEIDDDVVKGVLRRLYYPDSPYEFSVLPADILGQVYEQFLGQVIRLTAGHRAVIEDKPEVRRAGGVYYTPTHVVRHIVAQTMGGFLTDRSIRSVAQLRILDPACGSGSFLLEAYQHLLDWHLAHYSKEPAKNKTRIRQLAPDTYALTPKERKRILLNSIYGVDVDPQAVEVTKLSLLLKVLEGESDASLAEQLAMFRERALPDLADNIKCGNSLISSDYFSGELLDDISREEVNAFDWPSEFPQIMASGGFDVVIGNPPYDVVEKQRGAASWPHAALLRYVRTTDSYADALGGKLNLFRFFVVRSLTLTRPGGTYGMILPLALLADFSVARTRRHVLTNATRLETWCFPQKDNARRRIFRDAKLSTAIIVCERTKRPINASQASVHVRVYPWNSLDDPFKEANILVADVQRLDPERLPIPLTDEANWEICRRVHSTPRVERLGDSPYWRITRGEINQTVYRSSISADKTQAVMIKGVEVGRFHLNERLSQGEQEWLNEKVLLAHHRPKSVSTQRRIATQRITGVDERRRLVACIVEPPAYFADSTNSIEITSELDYELEYLETLLNSTLYQWRFKLTSTNNNVATNELEALPLRTIDFAESSDRALHQALVDLARRLHSLFTSLGLTRLEHQRAALNRQIAALEDEVNARVYAAFGLSHADINVVEGKVAEPGIAVS